jgi:hypothetical protein
MWRIVRALGWNDSTYAPDSAHDHLAAPAHSTTSEHAHGSHAVAVSVDGSHDQHERGHLFPSDVLISADVAETNDLQTGRNHADVVTAAAEGVSVNPQSNPPMFSEYASFVALEVELQSHAKQYVWQICRNLRHYTSEQMIRKGLSNIVRQTSLQAWQLLLQHQRMSVEDPFPSRCGKEDLCH